jgi:hypothetical protein
MDNNFIYYHLKYNNIYDIFENIFTRDIIDIIIKFIYKRKNKNLVNDIENFIITRDKLYKLYYNKYANHSLPLYNDNLEQLQITEDKYNLITDLELYLYSKNNIGYKIWKRKFGLNTKSDIDEFILKLEKTNIDRQVNLYLGILLPEERNYFYDLMKKNFKFIY